MEWLDVFSHFALPFLVVLALTRRRSLAFAAGVGGFAPDLDPVTSVLSLAPPLYWFGHRGFSHSLIGAPLYALGAVFLLRLRVWRRVLPVHEEVRFGVGLALVAVAFSYTHLFLDWLTMWGVPLFWPWSAERVSAGLFFYGATAMIPLSAYLVWRIARGTATSRTLRVLGVLLVAALVVSGGVRVVTKPGGEGVDFAQAASLEWSWTAFHEIPDGFELTFYSWGRVTGNATHLAVPPTEPVGEAALALARSHVLYRSFHLYAGGPEIVEVTPRDGGDGHNVTFVDLMVQAQVDRVPWLPFGEERAKMRLHVVNGSVAEIR